MSPAEITKYNPQKKGAALADQTCKGSAFHGVSDCADKLMAGKMPRPHDTITLWRHCRAKSIIASHINREMIDAKVCPGIPPAIAK